MNFNIIQNAAKYVRELSLEDHKEHLCGVDGKGNIRFVCHGDDHSVDFSGQDMDGIEYIVHSHPNACALSAQDIRVATFHDEIHNIAVTTTGSMYASKGINPDARIGRGLPDELRKMIATSTMMELEEKIHYSMCHESAKGNVEGDPNLLTSHFANLVAREKGLIHYEFVLSPQDKAMYERHNEVFHRRSGLEISLTS